jgi:hypothetical protein
LENINALLLATTNFLILFLISSLEDITPIIRIIVKILNCNFYRCSYMYLTLYTDIGDSIPNDYLNGSKAFIFSKLKTMSLTFLRILENWAENVAYFLMKCYLFLIDSKDRLLIQNGL